MDEAVTSGALGMVPRPLFRSRGLATDRHQKQLTHQHHGAMERGAPKRFCNELVCQGGDLFRFVAELNLRECWNSNRLASIRSEFDY